MAVKTTKRQNIWKDKKKLWLGVGLAAVIALVGFWLFGGSDMIEQRKMESYLKSKYGEEFVVENYRVEGSGLGVEGDPTADAYLKNDASVKFAIWDVGRYGSGEHAYADEYVSAKWARDEREVFEKSIYIACNCNFRFESKISIDYAVRNELSGRLPTLSTAITKYKGGVSLLLSVFPDDISSSVQKDAHANRVINLVNYLKTLPIRSSLIYGSIDGTKGIYLSEINSRELTKEYILSEMKGIN